MKLTKIILLFIVFLTAISCEKPSDCIESTGTIITKEIEVLPFEIVNVNSGIELIITEGANYKVTVQTGENLMPDIEVKQTGNVLSLKDNTSCNWVREYGQTKVFITAPNLTEIHSKTERKISSNGILTFPIFRLFALDIDADGIAGAGTNDFYIQVNNSQLVIETNNVARFYISGQTNEALLNFYEGDSRIEAANLTAQNIKVFHRGSNDMIVKPIQSITGKMVSTGNIILKNNPPVVEVQELYHGRVIYN
jgi:hypothetical protein